MEFEKNKNILNRELDQFNAILGEILPRYIELMKLDTLGEVETKELGQIEHYLIEVNGKIAEIKHKLDHDLFGETLEIYYKTKQEALNGNENAIKRLEKLKSVFSKTIKGDTFFNWGLGSSPRGKP